MSPDPEKCAIIKNWPAPSSCKEVKSFLEVKNFLQTIQFNAKFLGAEKAGEKTYPELTGPLRAMTKKNALFIWGPNEQSALQQIKDRLCSSCFVVIGSLQHMIQSNKHNCTVIPALWGHKH